MLDVIAFMVHVQRNSPLDLSGNGRKHVRVRLYHCGSQHVTLVC